MLHTPEKENPFSPQDDSEEMKQALKELTARQSEGFIDPKAIQQARLRLSCAEITKTNHQVWIRTQLS